MLSFVDKDTGEDTTLEEDNLDVMDDTIHFNTGLLLPRRHFNVTVTALSGSGSTAVSYANMSESITIQTSSYTVHGSYSSIVCACMQARMASLKQCPPKSAQTKCT